MMALCMARENSPVSYSREKYNYVRTMVIKVTDVCIYFLSVISVVGL